MITINTMSLNMMKYFPILFFSKGGGDEVFLDALYDSRERERKKEQILS